MCGIGCVWAKARTLFFYLFPLAEASGNSKHNFFGIATRNWAKARTLFFYLFPLAEASGNSKHNFFGIAFVPTS
jgi:hypothetical protein